MLRMACLSIISSCLTAYLCGPDSDTVMQVDITGTVIKHHDVVDDNNALGQMLMLSYTARK